MLAVDIGNTTVVVALGDGAGGWSAKWRFASPPARTADDWAAILLPLAASAQCAIEAAGRCIVSSVVPRLTPGFLDFCRGYLRVEPIRVSTALDLGIEIDVDQPNELGADRIANSVGAWERYRSSCIIVDMGTATKVEAIHRRGAYVGGAIAIGLGLSLDALAQRAAQLYSVPLAAPPVAIGRTTVDAVQAGVVGGHAHLVEGLIADTRSELGQVEHIILTGGYSAILAPLLTSITEVDPDLTLVGLRAILNRVGG